MIPVVRPRFLWLAFGLTLYGVLGAIVTIVILSLGGFFEPVGIVLASVGPSAWGIGAIGAGLASWSVVGGTPVRTVWLAAIMTTSALFWAVAYFALVSLYNWSHAETLVYCETPCPPDLFPLRVWLALALTATVLLVVVALASRQLDVRERIQLAAAVLVASIPFLNLAIFVNPERTRPVAGHNPT